MKAETLRLLSAGETAHALRLALGPRQWRDFLADCIRDHTPGLRGGLKLLPYATTKAEAKAARPLYRPRDVQVFIEQARRADSSLKPQSIAAGPYLVDTTIGVPWCMRRAAPVGV
jgi:hypothetical protein